MLSQVGSRYTGAAGNAYFDEYRQGGELSARFSARKFASRIAPGDTVVDFGCGSGLMLEELPGKLKIGIEPIESARISANDRGTQVVASATELQDDLADVVISNHALEQTLNPWSELRELHRILRDGGKLLLSLPLDDWRVQRYLLKRDKDQHLYTWTPRLLRNLLTEAGYA